MSPVVQQLAVEIRHLTQYTQDCEARVHNGENVDMRGMEDKTNTLCDTLLGLPNHEARLLMPQVKSLVEKLTLIEVTLRGKQS